MAVIILNPVDQTKRRYRLTWCFNYVLYVYVSAPMTEERALAALDGLEAAGAWIATMEAVPS